jgi:hypothetical protein
LPPPPTLPACFSPAAITSRLEHSQSHGTARRISFASWQTATGQEKIFGANVGLNVNPQLYNPGGGAVIGPPGYAPPLPLAYQLISGSPMIGAGLDLNAQFSINTGTQDYYGNANPRSGVYPIGAYGGPGR